MPPNLKRSFIEMGGSLLQKWLHIAQNAGNKRRKSSTPSPQSRKENNGSENRSIKTNPAVWNSFYKSPTKKSKLNNDRKGDSLAEAPADAAVAAAAVTTATPAVPTTAAAAATATVEAANPSNTLSNHAGFRPHYGIASDGNRQERNDTLNVVAGFHPHNRKTGRSRLVARKSCNVNPPVRVVVAPQEANNNSDDTSAMTGTPSSSASTSSIHHSSVGSSSSSSSNNSSSSSSSFSTGRNPKESSSPPLPSQVIVLLDDNDDTWDKEEASSQPSDPTEVVDISESVDSSDGDTSKVAEREMHHVGVDQNAATDDPSETATTSSEQQDPVAPPIIAVDEQVTEEEDEEVEVLDFSSEDDSEDVEVLGVVAAALPDDSNVASTPQPTVAIASQASPPQRDSQDDDPYVATIVDLSETPSVEENVVDCVGVAAARTSTPKKAVPRPPNEVAGTNVEQHKTAFLCHTNPDETSLQEDAQIDKCEVVAYARPPAPPEALSPQHHSFCRTNVDREGESSEHQSNALASPTNEDFVVEVGEGIKIIATKEAHRFRPAHKNLWEESSSICKTEDSKSMNDVFPDETDGCEQENALQTDGEMFGSDQEEQLQFLELRDDNIIENVTGDKDASNRTQSINIVKVPTSMSCQTTTEATSLNGQPETAEDAFSSTWDGKEAPTSKEQEEDTNTGPSDSHQEEDECMLLDNVVQRNMPSPESLTFRSQSDVYLKEMEPYSSKSSEVQERKKDNRYSSEIVLNEKDDTDWADETGVVEPSSGKSTPTIVTTLSIAQSQEATTFVGKSDSLSDDVARHSNGNDDIDRKELSSLTSSESRLLWIGGNGDSPKDGHWGDLRDAENRKDDSGQWNSDSGEEEECSQYTASSDKNDASFAGSENSSCVVRVDKENQDSECLSDEKTREQDLGISPYDSWERVWEKLRRNGWVCWHDSASQSPRYKMPFAPTVFSLTQLQDFCREQYNWRSLRSTATRKCAISSTNCGSFSRRRRRRCQDPSDSNSDETRARHHFADLWEFLKEDGWTVVAANHPLHSWYYLKPGVTKKTMKLGEDAFITPDEVTEYVEFQKEALSEDEGNKLTASWSGHHQLVRQEKTNGATKLDTSQSPSKQIDKNGKKGSNRNEQDNDAVSSGCNHQAEMEETIASWAGRHKRKQVELKQKSNGTIKRSATRSSAQLQQSCGKAKIRSSSRKQNDASVSSERYDRRNWIDLWEFLKEDGWTVIAATQPLHDWYYLKPGVTKKTMVLGENAFITPDEVIECVQMQDGFQPTKVREKFSSLVTGRPERKRVKPLTPSETPAVRTAASRQCDDGENDKDDDSVVEVLTCTSISEAKPYLMEPHSDCSEELEPHRESLHLIGGKTPWRRSEDEQEDYFLQVASVSKFPSGAANENGGSENVRFHGLPAHILTLEQTPPRNNHAITPMFKLSAVESPLYTVREFKEMWAAIEEDFGYSTEEIEQGKLVREANTRINTEDSTAQERAQYGRLLIDAVDFIFRELLDLKQADIFLDIGHGIGNTVLQAAHTFGCESRGIEVVDERNLVAEMFKANMEGQRRVHFERDCRSSPVGDIKFRHGRLEHECNRSWLTLYDRDAGSGSMKVLVNNFNAVFADRCAKADQSIHLDDYIAGLFALMKPGSKLVTLHPLSLPPSRSVATKRRINHGMPVDDNCSFYEVEKVTIGKAKDCVSWSMNGSCERDIVAYVYTRLEQASKEAVILCCNRTCETARNSIPIRATKIALVKRGQGDTEKCILLDGCHCGYTERQLRIGRK